MCVCVYKIHFGYQYLIDDEFWNYSIIFQSSSQTAIIKLVMNLIINCEKNGGINIREKKAMLMLMIE